jgi:hypothetical protein
MLRAWEDATALFHKPVDVPAVSFAAAKPSEIPDAEAPRKEP